MATLTAEERRRLVDGDGHDPYEVIDEYELGMDSHGCNIVLVVLANRQSPNLVGFTYRYSSEERFYDDDPDELVEVVSREVETTVYDRADGSDWRDHF